MTNPDYTAVQLVLDRSGSIRKILSDMQGGLQTFIEDQKKVPGRCTLRISQFDNEYEVVHGSRPISEVEVPSIHPRGWTALLDAWGRALTEFGEELAALPEDQRPSKVIFVVMTDGLENASKEWTYDQVHAATTEQREKWGWEFLFLGANMDAVKEGAKLGVPSANSITYDTDSKGVASSYGAVSASVTRTRGGGSGGFTQAEREAARSK